MPQTQGTMTEQEAEVLAARLVRVWGKELFESYEWTLEDEVFDFLGTIRGGRSIWIDNERDREVLAVSLSSWSFAIKDGVYLETGSIVSLSLLPNGDIAVGPPIREKEAKQFASEQMPFFRRGCWLSGCPIEARAHEKAEWMQGFSCEEIEAWNLKM